MPSRRTPRLAVEELTPGEIEIRGDDAHYLMDVLRLSKGDEVDLFDGRGRQASAEILSTQRRWVTVRVATPTESPQPLCRLTVGVASPKGDRADWLVEKLTEIGVARVVWILCEYSGTTGRPTTNRFARWGRLARAAAAQSGQVRVPKLDGPMKLDEFFALDADRRWICDLGGAPALSSGAARETETPALAVGPEGGFSPDELARAKSSGYTRVSLGSHTLRVETAAMIGAGMILGSPWLVGRDET